MYLAMKMSTIKGKNIQHNEQNVRPKISSLTTEERLTVIANLIIDKLLEKYSTKLESSRK